MAHHKFYSHIGIWLVVGCCGFCWWKGSRAERWGAGAILGADVCATLIGLASYPQFPYLGVFVVDFTLAVSLLILAIRFSSIWLGAAMILQGLELFWYAMQAGDEGFNRHRYAAWVNLQTGLMLLSMVGGAIASWRRRSRAKRAGSSTRAYTPSCSPETPSNTCSARA